MDKKIDKISQLQDLIERSKKLKKLGPLKFHKDYPLLVELTSFLPKTAHVKQRLWHVTNNIWEIPKCKICRKEVTWRKEHGTYNKYCSSKCSHSDKEVIEKIFQTKRKCLPPEKIFGTKEFQQATKNILLKKYNVDHSSKIPGITEKRRQTFYKKYGVSKTEKQLTEELGFYRIRDCGKKRWTKERTNANLHI